MKNLTIYETARVVGARALQLSMGAPPLLEVGGEFLSPVILAKREFDKGVVPLKIVR
ncbi:DNA-directed RNA polymerase subunit K [Candidatus Micrarchaeota archaeon CG_4_10_14_0_2_um_filter_60_11]|nr:MAG: DNA-directed RNA polymerase subunit K [Candidatus Micrarchaeota archaeon CG10_big_fil_rev_8_21_14_0_10_60_32]PIO02374.1 MAG: DNA-directed RNA polymerase subunit K [Candidatus Micrarchaeota archaeon CG09_land_8_20_14_0_10_60_16]PIY91587.1 MAG: DNA-directed RNA polymerase subunit K [Candidatus Micrarchaeota archaeon CG_4_10_14_0_8_um_filter_60_7]PIZ90724.1 MAG: DNA-directed RNA polymerase subunit K [Candidatus Micrarchaeota archaeon CG_4_10_14_0_2_um_filter_60_11]